MTWQRPSGRDPPVGAFLLDERTHSSRHCELKPNEGCSPWFETQLFSDCYLKVSSLFKLFSCHAVQCSVHGGADLPCKVCAPAWTAVFPSDLLTFRWNLWLTLRSLDETRDSGNKFIFHDCRSHMNLCLSSTHTHTHTHILNTLTRPTGSIPFTPQRATSWARNITRSVMCCAAARMNHIATMDDGIISIRGLWKVMFKLVPVRFKETWEYVDNDWWRLEQTTKTRPVGPINEHWTTSVALSGTTLIPPGVWSCKLVVFVETWCSSGDSSCYSSLNRVSLWASWQPDGR